MISNYFVYIMPKYLKWTFAARLYMVILVYQTKKNIIIDQFNSFVTIKSKNLSKTHSRLQGFACAIQIGYEDAIDLKCSVATCVV